MASADTYTYKKKQLDFFSDFVDSFAKTPFGNELGKVTNERAVAQSLKNLIKTNIGDRLFQYNIGSNIYHTLFEPNDQTVTINGSVISGSLDLIETQISYTIKNNEPRVILNNVEVKSAIKNSSTVVKGDQLYDENSIEITLYYYIINNPALITLNLILKRVR